MFLSKKNAIYFNKPKNIDPDKPRRRLTGSYLSIQDGKTMIKRKKHMSMLQTNTSRAYPKSILSPTIFLQMLYLTPHRQKKSIIDFILTGTNSMTKMTCKSYFMKIMREKSSWGYSSTWWDQNKTQLNYAELVVKGSQRYGSSYHWISTLE